MKLQPDACACSEHCCSVEHEANNQNKSAIEAGNMALDSAVINFVARCSGALNGGPCVTVQGAYHAQQAHGCPKASECALKISNAGRSQASSEKTAKRRRTVS
ncbi:hypothetical protein GW756_02270 [bacterium]|nr:hypothetical protein [bacterium]NCQ55619.1 hypothetical protein [Candidatus Parcubacteria bacterium]NCS67444.1 hypothetical protein [Candidatus Peregrinibacteria bacterium]NCS96170.1 hypothetical protein [bacterium]